MRLFQLILILLLGTASVWAHPTYTGYSGAPSRQTCASSCHGTSGGTVTITGFPTSYTPGQAYEITIGHTSGSTIANFNASCRLGTGSTNAGTITAGTGTATYNVSGETNGVHFSTTNQNSGTFTWTAPAAGYGVLRLYVGAHQGTYGGQNTALVLTSMEAAVAPGQASNPTPSDGGEEVPLDVTLMWTAGTGTTSHDVYLGTTNPPLMLGNSETNTFTPGNPLEQNTHYYWRIDERNDVGVTTGNVWQFTTIGVPGQASNPLPADSATDVLITDSLHWTPGPGANSHVFYLGTSNPPDSVEVVYDNFYSYHNLQPGTMYYWHVDAANGMGVTPGPLWHFTTLAVPGEATEPSPADGDTAITVRVTLSWLAGARTDDHDVYLGTTNPPPPVMQGQSGGSYTPPQNLQEGTLYYWRIGEHNSSGTTLGPVWSFRTENANSAGNHSALVPTELALGPVYPNPFNATVTIPFALPQASKVMIAIYDVTGRQVALMANGNYAAGVHSVQFSSEGVSSGVYFVRLNAGTKTLMTKVVALK